MLLLCTVYIILCCNDQFLPQGITEVSLKTFALSDVTLMNMCSLWSVNWQLFKLSMKLLLSNTCSQLQDNGKC